MFWPSSDNHFIHRAFLIQRHYTSVSAYTYISGIQFRILVHVPPFWRPDSNIDVVEVDFFFLLSPTNDKCIPSSIFIYLWHYTLNYLRHTDYGSIIKSNCTFTSINLDFNWIYLNMVQMKFRPIFRWIFLNVFSKLEFLKNSLLAHSLQWVITPVRQGFF